MGDADDSYNFLELDDFLEKLRDGNDIVIGNRFSKKMEKGAMKWSHKYIGTPLLSYIIRKRFNINIKDINCGLRGGKKESLEKLNCKSDGMEFASEMIIKAQKNNLKIVEVPINFYKDKREGKPHLKTIRDGIRHLNLIRKEAKIIKNEKLSLVKTLGKYIKIFVITLIICILSLILVTILPKGKIEEHCKEAAQIYIDSNALFPEVLIGRPNTTIDNYADSISLSIIYSLNSQDPIKSVMEAKYYENQGEYVTASFQKLVNGEAEANTDYLRYWHGYIILLKPLLMFFNIEQIHLINGVVVAILALILIKQLWKIDKRAIIALLIGFYMISISIVPQCFEYTWAFMIAFITSIIVLKVDDGNNKKIYPILFVTGMLTCFFDFLTVEILTVLLPVLMILIKRNKENRIKTLKDTLKFIIISILVWGIAYVGMYVAKWIIATIILHRDCINETIEKAHIRINGDVRYVEESKMWIEAIRRNFNNLYPIFFVRKKYIIYVSIPIIVLIILLIKKYQDDRYKTKQFIYLISILIIGLIPYIRYVLLTNHSCYHYIFTFRIQLATIMVFVLIVSSLIRNVKSEDR